MGFDSFKERSDATGTDPGPEPSMTKQSFKDEADLNRIMRKYLTTGVLPIMRHRIGAAYGEFADVEDYFACQVKLKNAEEAFMLLPSAVRSACRNEPGLLLELLQDPARRGEAVKLGLVEEPEVPAPAPAAAPAGVPPAGGAGETPPA